MLKIKFKIPHSCLYKNVNNGDCEIKDRDDHLWLNHVCEGHTKHCVIMSISVMHPGKKSYKCEQSITLLNILVHIKNLCFNNNLSCGVIAFKFHIFDLFE